MRILGSPPPLFASPEPASPACSQEFYRKRKIDNFDDLSESQKMRLQITCNGRQMIE